MGTPIFSLMIIDSSSLEVSPMGIVTILTTDGCQLLIVPLPQVSAVPPWTLSQAHLPSHLVGPAPKQWTAGWQPEQMEHVW